MKIAMQTIVVASLFFTACAMSRSDAAESDALAPDDPVKLTRTLEMLQDQMARGTPDSENARRTLVGTIGTRMLAADPAVWRDPHNVDAALLYVLSGGNPAVLARISATKDETRLALVSAVRAYAMGSPEEAKKLWAGIDLAALPVALIGPASLAKATLLTEDDPQQAMRFVDIARLEAPGTLIEEAAVRRGIEIAAKLGDRARFEFFATRYASRFPRSMYGEAFRRRFSEYYLAIAEEKGGQLSPRLAAILAPLADADRREIFLEIARLSIVGGKVALGRSAADSAAALSADGSAEMQRARLYRAAAQAVGDDSVSVRAELAFLQQTDLPPRDRMLLEAVSTLMNEIERWPPVVGKDEPPPVERVASDAATDDGDAKQTDVGDAARAAVAEAKRFLSDAGT